MSIEKIYYSVPEHCLDKVRAVLAVLKKEVTFEKISTEELSAKDSEAKGILLENPSGNLTNSVAIARYFALAEEKQTLLSKGDIESAQIDQWIEYSSDELETPLHLVLKLKRESAAELSSVLAKVQKNLNDSLSVLNDHLSTETYLVADQFSLADIIVAISFLYVCENNLVLSTSFPNIYRWARSIFSASPALEAHKTRLLNLSKIPTIGSSSDKWLRHRIRIKELLKLGEELIGNDVILKGWIRTSRSASKDTLYFIELNDGSSVKSVQLVISQECQGFQDVASCGGVGASLSIVGTVVASPSGGQKIEINVKTAQVLGAVYGGENGEIGGKLYPMSKKAHTLEFLREKAHLRPRSKLFSSALRIRNAMAYATHKFFNERGFLYVHTPLITAADCEGAGEQFAVTTLLTDETKVTEIPKLPTGKVDYSKDFFGKRTCLTVSGQLNVETHCIALSDVYTFGPTFRAENSHTARHLAEFWMIEPEIAFADLVDDMNLAEDYVKFCTKYALETCEDDIYYFEHEYPQGEKGLKARLENVIENEFARISYTDAVKLLQEHIKEKKVQFLVYPEWGDDLGSEHERYISEKIFQRPTIVINYPKGIKAFYMKLNDDKETVAAMDILVPKIGELIGGSQREDNLQILEERSKAMGLKPEDIWWYSDLRRFGSVPHAGFGLGFERLVMFITGLENIRDVISFPRVPGHAEF